MVASQRLSRGFHRLAVFVAAIPLLVGAVWTISIAIGNANYASETHRKLLCAYNKAGNADKPWSIPWDAFVKRENPFNDLIPIDNREVSLKRLGCSESEYDTATYKEVRDVTPTFNWFGVVAEPLGWGVAITIAVSLAVYGIVRAMGWVIGGFAAS
jgi:hypothetical protein